MSLADVRAGLANRCATISGLRTSDVWPDQIVTPMAIVRASPERVADPHTTFSGRGSYFLEVLLVVQIPNLERAQDALDPYIDFSGDQSIVAAIEGDETLGGKAEGVLIGEWYKYQQIHFGGVEYMSAALPVEVWVTY